MNKGVYRASHRLRLHNTGPSEETAFGVEAGQRHGVAAVPGGNTSRNAAAADISQKIVMRPQPSLKTLQCCFFSSPTSDVAKFCHGADYIS